MFGLLAGLLQRQRLVFGVGTACYARDARHKLLTCGLESSSIFSKVGKFFSSDTPLGLSERSFNPSLEFTLCNIEERRRNVSYFRSVVGAKSDLMAILYFAPVSNWILLSPTFAI